MPAPTLSSRWLNVPLERDVAGRRLFGIRTPMPFRPVVGIRRVTLSASDTLFNMAFREYGDAMLYWAIADFNGIFDPTTELRAGRVILIPPRLYIDNYLMPRDS